MALVVAPAVPGVASTMPAYHPPRKLSEVVRETKLHGWPHPSTIREGRQAARVLQRLNTTDDASSTEAKCVMSARALTVVCKGRVYIGGTDPLHPGIFYLWRARLTASEDGGYTVVVLPAPTKY